MLQLDGSHGYVVGSRLFLSLRWNTESLVLWARREGEGGEGEEREGEREEEKGKEGEGGGRGEGRGGKMQMCFHGISLKRG